MRAENEDRFRMLLDKRMDTEVTGRFRFGGKNGSRPGEQTQAAAKHR
jgi:hypothetical protein